MDSRIDIFAKEIKKAKSAEEIDMITKGMTWQQLRDVIKLFRSNFDLIKLQFMLEQIEADKLIK